MYRLLKNHEGNNEYIPVFDFMGDIYSPEFKKGGFVSHECSARLSEINKENPVLLEIEKQQAKYTKNIFYCYRLRAGFTVHNIYDEDIKNLAIEYDKCK